MDSHILNNEGTKMKQDPNLGLSDSRACFFQVTISPLDNSQPLPPPRHRGTRKVRLYVADFSLKAMQQIPLLDLFEEKLDRGEI